MIAYTDFLYPTYFTKQSIFWIHPQYCKWKYFILCVANILLCAHVCVCVCVCTVVHCSAARSLSISLWPHGLQHTGPPWTSPSPGMPLAHVHCISDAIQPSHPLALFSFCPQSFLASRTFPMSWLLASGDQITGASSSASVLPMSTQHWIPLRLVYVYYNFLSQSCVNGHLGCLHIFEYCK